MVGIGPSARVSYQSCSFQKALQCSMRVRSWNVNQGPTAKDSHYDRAAFKGYACTYDDGKLVKAHLLKSPNMIIQLSSTYNMMMES